jgi:hypothetical protein
VSASRSAAGRLISREQDRNFIGVSKYGVEIARPDFAPKNFTVNQLDKVLRDLKGPVGRNKAI